MSITYLDDEQNREKLKGLRIEHRKLDDQITSLQLNFHDSLAVRRMKKNKLALKEIIVKLESQMIPDLNA